MQTLQNGGRRSIAALGFLLVALTLLAPVALRAAPTAQVVMDARTGEILHARNHDTRLHPASLTKMMTLYIAFEAVRNGEITLDTPVRVSANAAGTACSCLGLRAGQTIALRYLLRAAAVRSSNDAATAIAEAIGGTEAAFIERMNRTARALGMTNTTFRNAHGLTAPGHLSTARDMTILGRQLYFDYPQYWNLWSRRSADAGIAQVVNTNRAFLDGYAGADGIKTGFTRAAGFNLTASAERGGRRIIVTVFGGQSVPDRTRRVTELMDLGFREAPARAAVRPPAPPNYGSQPPAAAALAQATPTPERPAAGRSIRLATAVARSPIPPMRPAPAARASGALIAAIEQEIDSAVAAAPPAEVTPPQTRPAEAAPATLPFQLAGAGSAALPAADPTPPAARDDAPARDAAADAATLPFALATAAPPERPEEEAPLAATVDAPGDDATSPLAVATAPIPPQRPQDLIEVDSPEMVADVPADSLAEDGPEAAEILLAEAVAQEPVAAGLAPVPDAAATPERDGTLLRAALPLADAPSALAGADRPEGLRTPDPGAAAGGADDFIVLTFTTPDSAEPLRLASLARTGRAEPMPQQAPAAALDGEVVLRQVSTSEPRLWAVSLGRFGTRDAAERALMRAALAELASFDGALRRVQSRQGGFEATFVGLSEGQALVACDRLRARDHDCATMAP